MGEPGMATRPIKAKRRLGPLSNLPWRSGGASALLIVIMSSFDDSLFDLELLGSSAESLGEGADSSSSGDQTSGGRRVQVPQGAMPVMEDGRPDPNALTNQDYSDIPSV